MPIQNLSGNVWRPLTFWAWQNLPLLTSSCSGWRALVQILIDSVDSQTCRPKVIWRLRPLCFYGRCISLTVPAGCTGWLYRHDLPKFLRVSNFLRLHKFSPFPVQNQKFYLGFLVSYHCTENSYMITVAVQIQLLYSQTPKWRLSFGRGCQDLAIILLGEGVWGGRKWERRPVASVIAFEGGVRRGGGMEGRGRANMSLHQMQPCACSFHSISLSQISVLLLQPLSI